MAVKRLVKFFLQTQAIKEGLQFDLFLYPLYFSIYQ